MMIKTCVVCGWLCPSPPVYILMLFEEARGAHGSEDVVEADAVDRLTAHL